MNLFYIDRASGQKKVEKIYGKVFIKLLYGTGWVNRFFSFLLLPLFSNLTILSKWYGWLQKSRYSRRKIKPFIKKFHINSSEFLDPVSSFQSFNDFFTRRLKPESRLIAPGNHVAILPADGRYLIYKNLKKDEGFFVKGRKWYLETLLCQPALVKKYSEGSMVVIRLAPVDYHRFHFPLRCIPGKAHAIPGKLFSVNPLALKKKGGVIFIENKRMITSLKTNDFGELLFIEIGATYVGSIHQTFIPGKMYEKGREKGYFSYGGSSIILLFEPHRIQFDHDLLQASSEGLETLGHLGQSLGRC